MLIVCPNCSAAYRIELSALGSNGRSVRCARCKEVWRASALDAVTADFPADAPASPHATPASPAPPPPPRLSPSPVRQGAEDYGSSPTSAPFRLDASAPSIVPSLDPEPKADDSTSPEGGPDIEGAPARKDASARLIRVSARKRRKWPMSKLGTAILTMASLVALVLGFRQEIVRHAPQTASVYEAIGMPVNLRGLVFEEVKVTREAADGLAVIVVEGLIVNTLNRPAYVPRLRFSVLNAAGHEKYAWTALPAQEILRAGEALRFSSRLASPPADGAEILVRFFNRRDAIEGLRSEANAPDGPVKSPGKQ